jgi:hypothetical protein
MSEQARRVWLLVLVVVAALLPGPRRWEAASVVVAAPKPSTPRARWPVTFEANTGRYDPSIRFVGRQGRAAVALRDDGATIILRSPGADAAPATKPIVLHFAPEGGRKVAPRPEGLLVTKTSYFIGADPTKWRTDVPSYARVTYPSVLPNVDLVYHADNGALEYDLVVAPGVDVDGVVMKVSGAESVSLTDNGELRIHTGVGDLIQPPPVAYQTGADGRRSSVGSSYRLVGENAVGFRMAAYERSRALVIDPMLSYSTYLGGASSDSVSALATDTAGNTYLAGLTSSPDFPTLSAYDTTVASTDAFIAKLDPSGQQLLYSTYLGGLRRDGALALAVAPDGTVYVGGRTEGDFPVVNGPPSTFDPYGSFLAHLNATGDGLIFATHIPRVPNTSAMKLNGLAADASGVYVSILLHDANGYLMKVTPDNSAVLWQLSLQGTKRAAPHAIALDSTGAVFVAGSAISSDFQQTPGALKPSCDVNWTDGFIARVKSDGTGFDWATCIGGSNIDNIHGLAIDAANDIYVTGETASNDFPTLAATSAYGGNIDAFVAKIDGTTHALVYSRYLGGLAADVGYGVAVDSAGAAWVTGSTSSINFPTISATQPTLAGGIDAFVTRLGVDGSHLQFSTFYGGSAEDVGSAIVARGSTTCFAGSTSSADLAIVNPLFAGVNAGGNDGFVAKISTLNVMPSVTLLGPGQTQQFTASEGTAPYTFAIASQGAGGSITSAGLYTASPAATSGMDIVLATDQTGQTGTGTVFVASSPISVTPAQATSPPRGQLDFIAAGGVGPYAFSFQTNASAGRLMGSTYFAGINGNTVDVVRVADRTGGTTFARVDIGPGVTIAPAAPGPIPPRSSLHFTATGGSGGGYVWTLVTSSLSTIDGNGNYTAGPFGESVDTVRATDSLGNLALVNVPLNVVRVDPSDPKTPPRGTVTFGVVGGAPPYSWSVHAESGGTIDASSGLYVAGDKGSTTDVITALDSLGNQAQSLALVGPPITITPERAAVGMGTSLPFAVAGGSGQYTLSIDPNESGSTITAGSVFNPGLKEGTDVIHAADSLGNTAIATVRVVAGRPIGADAGSEPDDKDALDASIDDGGTRPPSSVTITMCGCRAVGRRHDGTKAEMFGIGTSCAVALALSRRRRRRQRSDTPEAR